MATETTHNIPDEFLQKASELDTLFADIGMPLTFIGETALKKHLVATPDQDPTSKTREQQAAEYFGKTIFPASILG